MRISSIPSLILQLSGNTLLLNPTWSLKDEDVPHCEVLARSLSLIGKSSLGKLVLHFCSSYASGSSLAVLGVIPVTLLTLDSILKQNGSIKSNSAADICMSTTGTGEYSIAACKHSQSKQRLIATTGPVRAHASVQRAMAFDMAVWPKHWGRGSAVGHGPCYGPKSPLKPTRTIVCLASTVPL